MLRSIAILLLLAAPARAASITYTGTFWQRVQVGSLQQFNPSLGTLTSVRFTATGDWDSVHSFPASVLPIAGGTYRNDVRLDLTRTDGFGPSFLYRDTGTFDATQQVVRFSGDVDLISTTTDGLEKFYGAGKFNIQTVQSLRVLSPDIRPLLLDDDAFGTVAITYTFAPPGTIPGPSSAVMTAIGMAAVLGVSWRRSRWKT